MGKRRRYTKAQNMTNIVRTSVIVISIIFVIGIGIHVVNRQEVVSKTRQEELAKKEENQSKMDFINQIAPIAQVVNRQYGLFPSLTIAQAILESDFGRSGLATQYNNLFGVKGTNNPNSRLLETKEYVNGEWVTIKDWFRIYDSYASSIKDHALLFVNGTTWNPRQYIDVLNAKTVEEAAKALQKDGYATDPSYAEKILNLINEYNLRKYD